jgi:hypothetical protein
MYHPGVSTYEVQTHVSSATFREFLRAIDKGCAVSLTREHVSEISLLPEGFGVDRLK